MARARSRLVLAVVLLVLSGAAADADVLVEEPVVEVLDNEAGPFTAAVLDLCPPEICVQRATPPEGSGAISCSWSAGSGFRGRRAQNGTVHGTWSGFYSTTDCLSGSHEPVHMGYLFVRASNSLGSAVYQTVPSLTCTSRSRQCSGLTGTGNDAGCSPCNGWWYLTVTSSYRLHDRFSGVWPAPDPDGPCSRSSDRRQLDCQKTTRVLIR